MKILELLLIINILLKAPASGQTTTLDNFYPFLQVFRDIYFNLFNSADESKKLKSAEKLNKLQPRIPENIQFPCPLNNSRSNRRPLTVHALKPGDIDVVGAIGDSLTAGNGLTATSLLHIALQNRGASYAIGGQGTWRQYTTLPNVLKEFNPNLIGYSLGDSFINYKESQFNVAEAVAMSRDMMFMTNELIRRIKTDPRVNIEQDWKMITFMVGGNDFCVDMCFYKKPEVIVENHKKDLIKVLRLLRDNLPRTIVSVILAPHLRILRTLSTRNRPRMCYFSQIMFCPCLFGLEFENQQKRFDKIMKNWQRVEDEVVNRPEFDSHDFTAVVQPFLLNYEFHKSKEGLTDYSSLSADCFHLSQKENAKAATSLWNNLLEPVGAKSTKPSEIFYFKCPTENQPYIFTRRNSREIYFH